MKENLGPEAAAGVGVTDLAGSSRTSNLVSDERLRLLIKHFRDELPQGHEMYEEAYSISERDAANAMEELLTRRAAETTREHIESEHCWCKPTLNHVAEDGTKHWVHHEPN